MTEIESLRLVITPPPTVDSGGEVLHRSSVPPAVIAGRVMWSRTRHIVQERMRAWWMARLEDGHVPSRLEASEHKAHIEEQIAAELAAVEDGRPESACAAVRVAYGIAMDSARRARDYDALEAATRTAAIEAGANP